MPSLAGQTSEFSEDSEESATPLAGGTEGTVMMPLKQLPLNSSTYGESEDALCFEIMLGSSSELTPIAPPIPQVRHCFVNVYYMCLL